MSKRIQGITIEIDGDTFNDVLRENNKCIRKIRKYFS